MATPVDRDKNPGNFLDVIETLNLRADALERASPTGLFEGTTMQVPGSIITPGSVEIEDRALLKGFLNLQPEIELTIAAGVIDVAKTYHTVETQSGDPSDDLDTVDGGITGDIVLLRPADTTHTVVAKDGAGNLALSGDFTMDDDLDTLLLLYDGAVWIEIGRVSPSGPSPSVHNIFSPSHADTVPGAAVRGALMYGDATPSWNRLTHPGANYVLGTDANDALWKLAATSVPLPPVAEGDILIANNVPAWSIRTLGAQFTHLEAGAATATWVVDMTMQDDAWIGLDGGAAGRIVFDNTPTPDQIHVVNADIHRLTTGVNALEGIFVTNTAAPTALGGRPFIYLEGGAPGFHFIETNTTDENLLFVLDSGNMQFQHRFDDGTLHGIPYQFEMTAPTQTIDVAADGTIVFNATRNFASDFRVGSNNLTHMLFVDAGFDSVLINSSADLSSTFGVVTTALGDIGIVVRGSVSQAANLQEWQSNAPATLLSVEPDGDLNFSTGIGIIHADGVSAGPPRQLLIADGTRYVPGTLAATDLAAHDLLGAQHGDTVAQAVTRGSLIYGNSTPKWDELVIGAASTHLESDGTDVAWAVNLTMADGATIGQAAGPLLTFDDTNNFLEITGCKVGIGTATPLRALHVNGNTSDVQIRIDTTSADPALTLTTLAQQDWSIGIDFSDGGKLKIGESTIVGTATRMTIDSDGNVGINTTGPDRKLDVLDASNPQLRLTHTDGAVYTDLQTTASGYLFIDPSADRTGFRTSTPNYIVHIPWQAGDAVSTLLVGDSTAAANNQIAVRGDSWSNVGIRGTSETSGGVQGISISDDGGNFQSTSGQALYCQTTTGVVFRANLLGAGAAIARFQDNGTTVVQVNDAGLSPLEVVQPGAGGAVAVLGLEQDDIGEPFIHYDGTSVNGAITGSFVDQGDQSGNTLEGWIRLQITDTAGNIANGDYWLPFYSLT